MIPCAGTMRDRARAHCTISVFNAHIVIKGPRYQMRGGPPVIRASDRPIIPSALLTKNIMPISRDLFRACAEPCSLCPCPTPYFLFSSYLDSPPSSLSLSFHLGETYHVRSLPPSSRLVSSRPSTLLPFAFRRSLQSMRGTGCYRNTRATFPTESYLRC